MSESLISIIRLFNREGRINCVIVRSCGEQMCAISVGRNEGEPHLMSLENLRTSELSLCTSDEGRRETSETSVGEPGCKQLLAFHRTGGVREDGMLRSVSRRSWEILRRSQEVGVLNSSDEVSVMEMKRSRGTCVNAIQRRKGSGDGEQ